MKTENAHRDCNIFCVVVFVFGIILGIILFTTTAKAYNRIGVELTQTESE